MMYKSPLHKPAISTITKTRPQPTLGMTKVRFRARAMAMPALTCLSWSAMPSRCTFIISSLRELFQCVKFSGTTGHSSSMDRKPSVPSRAEV